MAKGNSQKKFNGNLKANFILASPRSAEDPDHMIHFNGERFLGPYPDVVPTK